MNKVEFIEKYATDTNITKVAAKETIECIMNTIIDVLASGESFEYPGFGKFVINEQAARTARNPKTGEEVSVPAKKVVKFKVAKALKDAVSEL